MRYTLGLAALLVLGQAAASSVLQDPEHDSNDSLGLERRLQARGESRTWVNIPHQKLTTSTFGKPMPKETKKVDKPKEKVFR